MLLDTVRAARAGWALTICLRKACFCKCFAKSHKLLNALFIIEKGSKCKNGEKIVLTF